MSGKEQPKVQMDKEAAARIQSGADKGQGDKELAGRAQAAVDKNANASNQSGGNQGGKKGN